MRVTDIAEEAHEELSRFLTVASETVAVLTMLASPLRGASYDSDGGSTRCLTHQCALRRCWQDDRDGCEADRVPGGDPTGEAGSSDNPARIDMRRLVKAAAAALNAARELTSIAEKHRNVPLVSDKAGIGHCENTSCERYCDGVKERLRPSIDGKLRLCNACRMREQRAAKAS